MDTTKRYEHYPVQPRERSYTVRRRMALLTDSPDGRDLSGSFLARIVSTTHPLPYPLVTGGYEVGDVVVVQTTSNAGFRGIVCTGSDLDDERPPWHDVNLGHFDILEVL